MNSSREIESAQLNEPYVRNRKFSTSIQPNDKKDKSKKGKNRKKTSKKS